MSLRLFGIETEYGIAREDLAEMDPVIESMELVRAGAAFTPTWDYQGEDPHRDARGFRVSRLEQDEEEDTFAARDAHRPFSYREMKSDLVLTNGARFYNDHTHPEYATPECRTLKDVVAQDRAGERLVQQAAERRNRTLTGTEGRRPVQLYKNNTDFHGHSYGCHDNYLLDRATPFAALAAGLVPFLVSRQLLAGAGKVGLESSHGLQPGVFQLSQRADFIETELSVNTMHHRPILNTRDEPHADARRYRRLHLILGDANMCEYATALKVGTTQVVLELIARGAAPAVELEAPVAAIQALSRDPDLKTLVRRKTGGTISGLDLQEVYLAQAGKVLEGTDADTDWVLREWAEVLRLLPGRRDALIGRLDWVTKQWLLESFIQEERLGWDDPWIVSLDLEYHNVNPERGLHRALEADGKVARLTTDAEIQWAMAAGPADTRGGIRGLCVQRFREQIESVQWERITFKQHAGGRPAVLDLNELVEPPGVIALARRLAQATTPAEVSG